MNYEEKYKAALNWMASLYDGLHGKTREEAETYFPELKESEDNKDKRISKEITKFLKQNNGWNREWLAWLERQCEQVNCPQNLQVPNGGIVLEDFNGGEGHYKVNLDFLNKKQVEEIEKIVNDWNKINERR